MKKIISLCLTLAMVFSTFANVKTADVNAEEVYNFALDATVTTSSDEHSSLAGKFANDGDMSTRWSSVFADNQWIQLDFGKIVKIGSVVMHWEAAYAKQYKLSWSQDGDTWYDAVEWGGSNSPYTSESSHMFYNRPVRYIRLTCLKRGTNYGVSLFEFQALGYKSDQPVETTEAPTTEAPTTEAPTTKASNEVVDLAKTATATATSIEGAEYTADKAIDGNMDTRWSSSFKDGEAITLDLGSICKVGSIIINWEAAYAKNYKIAWSQDGSTWHDAVEWTNSEYIQELSHMFYNRPVRYIRVTCVKRGTPYGASIFEINVLGTKGEEVATTEKATEATTVAPTTVAPTTVAPTTTVEETTTKAEVVKPLEVMGEVITTPRDRTIAVVWGQDAERINSGCRYNVYVNNKLMLGNVVCGYYELKDLGIGDAQVVIKSVLNGVESNGIKKTVTVTGTEDGENIALGSTATATNEFNGHLAAHLVDGNNLTGWMAQQAFPSVSIDLGSVKSVRSFEIVWYGETDSPRGCTVSCSEDGKNWTQVYNIDKYGSFKAIDKVSVNRFARYFSVSMGGYRTPAHFYGARAINIYS